MAFKDFVSTWKVYKETCNPREETGHTITISDSEGAVTVCCTPMSRSAVRPA